MDSQLKNEIAGILKDIFNPPFGVNLRAHDDTLMTRGGGKGLKLYDEIERDPHAFAILQKRKMSVIAYPWEVEAASSSRIDKKAADFIKANFNAINFDKVTLDLLDANLKGYSVGEIMWGTDGSQIVVDRIMPRDQRRFAFDYDYKLRLLTWQNMWPGEEMPDKKFIVHSTGAKDGSPYGIGLGTRLFWPVWFKKQSIQFWLTFADKYGSPTAIGKYPSGTSASDQDNLLNALGAIAQESAIAVPDNMTVELLEAARSSAGDFYERMCKYMDDQMSVAVLGENSTTSGKSSGMNSNQAQVHNEVRLELSKADADLLSGTLSNTIVKWLTEFNFSGATPPRVWRRIAQQEDLKSRSERDARIFNLGFKPTLDYITETYGDGWELRDIPTAAIQMPAGDSNKLAAAFAEADTYPDQVVLDRVINAISASDMQAIAEGFIKPVIEQINKGGDAAEVLGLLAEAYPDMDESALADKLNQLLFAAKVWGRLSAEADLE